MLARNLTLIKLNACAFINFSLIKFGVVTP